MSEAADAALSAKDALSAEDLMKRMYDELKPFVEVHAKGHLSVARDPLEIIELLGTGPGTFRVILNWAGERLAPGTHRDSGVVVHEFTVTVSHNRGLSILPGQSAFVLARGEGKTLVALNAIVREKMRGLRFPDGVTDQILTYQGTEPIVADEKPIDAFTQTWNLTAILPPATP